MSDDVTASKFLGRHASVPFVPLETTRDHLFKLLDILNPLAWATISTREACQEVILVLLNCAVRSLEKPMLVQKAVNLIQSNAFREVLGLGVQDGMFQIGHRKCIDCNKLSESNGITFAENASLYSQTWSIRASQLSSKGKLVAHLASLCSDSESLLQGSCRIANAHEAFMFKNYVALVNLATRTEKFYLVDLLPELFQWNEEYNIINKATGYKPENNIVINPILEAQIGAFQYIERLGRITLRDKSPLPAIALATLEQEITSLNLDTLLDHELHDANLAETVFDMALIIKRKGEKLLGLANLGMPSMELIKRLINIVILNKDTKQEKLNDLSFKKDLLVTEINLIKEEKSPLIKSHLYKEEDSYWDLKRDIVFNINNILDIKKVISRDKAKLQTIPEVLEEEDEEYIGVLI